MSAPPEFALASFLKQAAQALPAAQRSLDSTWAADFQAAQSLPNEFAPCRQSITQLDLQCSFLLDHQARAGGSFALRPWTMSYERRFAHAPFLRHKIAVKVVSQPIPKENFHG